MKGPTLTLVVLFFVVPIWSVAMWAMLMMIVRALNGERFTSFLYDGVRFFTAVQAPYNRKYLRLFAACIAALTVIGIAFNVLYIEGLIEP